MSRSLRTSDEEDPQEYKSTLKLLEQAHIDVEHLSTGLQEDWNIEQVANRTVQVQDDFNMVLDEIPGNIESKSNLFKAAKINLDFSTLIADGAEAVAADNQESQRCKNTRALLK